MPGNGCGIYSLLDPFEKCHGRVCEGLPVNRNVNQDVGIYQYHWKYFLANAS